MNEAPYSPRRRTALVLSGTGTAGAYHAGVLMALHEAGIKIDLVAGRGIGAGVALFDAVDGGAALWAAGGPWRSRPTPTLYRFRLPLRLAAWSLLLGVGVLLAPLALLAVAVLVYLAGLFLSLIGLTAAGSAVASWFAALLARAFAPAAIPTVIPRLVALALVIALAILVVDALAGRLGRVPRRRSRGAVWWRLAGPPLSAEPAIESLRSRLWLHVRGAAALAEPPPAEVGRRYAELLIENLGQPGFREVLLAVHDLDARHDLVFALLKDPHRHGFFAGASRVEAAARNAEACDLAGVASQHVVDALAAALSLPVVTEPHLLAWAPESYWRGEAHRVSDRPDLVTRLLAETARAGAEQIVIVTDAPPAGGPHALALPRVDPVGRAGEYVRATETAAVGDALRSTFEQTPTLFVIRPAHNPVGPFDVDGADDRASDRRQSLAELVDRGYEDAYRQFIEPVVGASGDGLGVATGAPPAGPTRRRR
jgi:hypothetical protein